MENIYKKKIIKENSCCICLDNTPSILFKCGHFCVCSDCRNHGVEDSEPMLMVCPLCKTKSNSYGTDYTENIKHEDYIEHTKEDIKNNLIELHNDYNKWTNELISENKKNLKEKDIYEKRSRCIYIKYLNYIVDGIKQDIIDYDNILKSMNYVE